MGIQKWGHKSSDMAHQYSYPTYKSPNMACKYSYPTYKSSNMAYVYSSIVTPLITPV